MKFSTRFGHVQVERDHGSTYASFLKLFKTIFQKNVPRAILYPNHTPATEMLGLRSYQTRETVTDLDQSVAEHTDGKLETHWTIQYKYKEIENPNWQCLILPIYKRSPQRTVGSELP